MRPCNLSCYFRVSKLKRKTHSSTRLCMYGTICISCHFVSQNTLKAATTLDSVCVWCISANTNFCSFWKRFPTTSTPEKAYSIFFHALGLRVKNETYQQNITPPHCCDSHAGNDLPTMSKLDQAVCHLPHHAKNTKKQFWKPPRRQCSGNRPMLFYKAQEPTLTRSQLFSDLQWSWV